ncbi:copper amine oxidase N-terminal domain-containing protein [Aneurinibacillus sp. Ricciae_BoGa-3]|uniref:copper amine oxidase N-terminal domain-containing protein n=1 Tax=Aneurinibacillus sp. Ricciae_BoGa-3 TaxID=3022697 RepID=UPI0023423657|nr:copper amine oxidase N-terminal domain-containing protein [Aneurinibacillus sp. Ricciae_BoGa-3]WCK54281.1 copper amine oxidase N-terminal domain-containing protein [Aneurinibacillus sp. Ricciae_BoGa-3]
MKSNKTLKVLATSALAVSMAVPAASAFAATYSTPNVLSVSNGQTNANLGRIQVQFNGSELSSAASGDFLIVTLPSDYDLHLPAQHYTFDASGNLVGTGVTADHANHLSLDLGVGDNYLTSTSYSSMSADVLANNQIKINFSSKTALDAANTNNKAVGVFYINLNNIAINGASNGPVNASVEGLSGGAFNSGSVTVANIGTGSVSTSIDSVKTITSGTSTIDSIRIKEDRPGILTTNSGDKMKYKLPDGFKWAVINSDGTASALSNTTVQDFNTAGAPKAVDLAGNPSTVKLGYSIDDDGRTLYVKNTGTTNTQQAGYWMLENLGVVVNDETVAKQGDVDVAVSGKGNVSTTNSDLIVAKYGDYSTKVYAVGDPKSVYAGAKAVKVGEFAIEESAPNSLIAGRTITLTLDGNAKWSQVSSTDALSVKDLTTDNAQSSYPNSAVINTSSSNNGAQAYVVGSDRKTIKFVIGSNANRSNAIKQVLKNANIDVAPSASGDIKVNVGGTEGVTGSFTVAKVVAPVSATLATDPSNVTIGTQGQSIPDVTIKEAGAGAIDYSSGQSNNIQLIFPQGVIPTVPTSVSVTDGDLSLDTTSISRSTNPNDGRWVITIPVKSGSTKASTIKVSGLTITADRTVPVGNIDVQVGGTDLNETGSIFGNYDGVTSFTAAKIATPAPTDSTSSNIVFKLNSKTFTIDGKETTMDAAPLVKWDRAFLPVRFAANALNVSDSNIIWDDATNTATIFKGATVITARVGDKFLTVNGTKVSMPVPVYRDKAATNNRVMIPIRYLSNALGADIQWNTTTGEITINAAK